MAYAGSLAARLSPPYAAAADMPMPHAPVARAPAAPLTGVEDSVYVWWTECALSRVLFSAWVSVRVRYEGEGVRYEGEGEV